MPIYLGAKESPLEEFRRVQQEREAQRVERSDVGTMPDLFGGDPATTRARKQRGRQQAVFCLKCGALDSIFWGGGVKLSSKRCVTCGGELCTSRARSAKLQLYDAIMKRNVALTLAAAHGDGDINTAAEYAEYAAHTAFSLKLVPYGPEPSRK